MGESWGDMERRGGVKEEESGEECVENCDVRR